MTTSENSTAYPGIHDEPDEPQRDAPAQRPPAARSRPQPGPTLFAADLDASIPVAT
jgi:hypothetical protein